MRIYVFAIAMALFAQPAWAHHKPNHPDFATPPVVMQVARDPCALSNNPHQTPAAQALAQRCRTRLLALRGAPSDVALRERCDRAARALSGQSCNVEPASYSRN